MAYSKRCIVTGAAGFIGSALARLLLKETEATVAMHPAWRLVRMGNPRMPRTDWPARWRAAGEYCGWEGASKEDFVALKGSPIWQALGDGAGGFKDTLGNPYPPFAYSSTMAWEPVDRDECAALALDPDGASPTRAAEAAKRFGFDVGRYS